MKHIDIMFHFVQENLNESDIELKKIHKENPANMLTKVIAGVNSSIARSYSISF